MRTEEVGSTREEAERLIAAGLGAVSTALQDMEAKRQLRALAEQVLVSDRVQDFAAGLNGFVTGVGETSGGGPSGSSGGGPSGGGPSGSSGGEHRGSTAFSTGSADCCVCPVCRLIAALRDPSPEFAEQMASAVGDLAVGLTGLLRALSTAMAGPGGSGEQARSGERVAKGDQATAGGPVTASEPAAAGPVPTPRVKPGGDAKAGRESASRDSGILLDPASNTMSDSPSSGKPGARKPMAKKAVKKAVRRDTGK
jgi:hypothetical protein